MLKLYKLIKIFELLKICVFHRLFFINLSKRDLLYHSIFFPFCDTIGGSRFLLK